LNIYVTSVPVDDQEKALEFYTNVLGFKKKNDVPLGKDRWLTVTSPNDENGVELLLEPSSHPAVRPFKDALMEDGIPYTSFSVNKPRVGARAVRKAGRPIHTTASDARRLFDCRFR